MITKRWEVGTKLVSSSGTRLAWDARCSNQDTWESNGWRAVEPPAPVERKLAEGWDWFTSEGNSLCNGTSCTAAFAEGERFVCGDRHGNRCGPCAEKAGAFADAPVTETATTRPCADWCGTLNGCGGSNLCRGVGPNGVCRCASPSCRGLLSAPKAPPVVEKAKPMTCSCGSVELVAMRVLSVGHEPAATCQACYLALEDFDGERTFSRDAAATLKKMRDPKPRPAAHLGVTPVVFGLGVGILARGMRR